MGFVQPTPPPFDLDEWPARKQVAAIRSGKRITGHTARLRDEPLWSYLAGGVSDDHNAATTEEVLERRGPGLTAANVEHEKRIGNFGRANRHRGHPPRGDFGGHAPPAARSAHVPGGGPLA